MGRKRKKKMKKKGIITEDGDEDRISNLPESLIHHILSFLMMRDVTRTCLLSKRWRNIWKSAPVLRFGALWHDHPGDNELIDQALIHYEGQKVKTLQVDINCRKNARRLESWVRFAAMHGVEELDLSADPYDADPYDGPLPSCLFECLEMRVLKFSLYDFTPQPFCFPLLTKLHFTNFKWNYLDTSACPHLEGLFIEVILYTSDSSEIHAPNPKLRYLNISEYEYISETEYFHDNNSRLTLYAPNVINFEFAGSFGRFYEFKDMSSVKTLNLYSSVDPNDNNENVMAFSLVNLLEDLIHVKSLKLSQSCILILALWEAEIPSLSFTCLELDTNLSKYVLVGITFLLSASRCIERLIINMGDHYNPDETIVEERYYHYEVEDWESLENALSEEFALHTILIRNIPGDVTLTDWYRDCYNGGMEPNMDNFLKSVDLEIKLVEALLKSSKMLNKMNISFMKLPSQPQYFDGLTKKLLVFPRASLNAEVYIS